MERECNGPPSQCAHGETKRETELHNRQFDKLRCELWQNSQHKLTAIWRLGCERQSNGEREGRLAKEWVWSRSSHVSGKRSDLRKCLQADGRTDDARCTMAAHWRHVALVVVLWCPALSASVTALRWEPVNVHV